MTGVSSLDPSGYVTFTGISTDIPGVASAGGVTVTVPLSGSTSAVQPSGIPAGGISNVVPGGTFGSFVCGTSTGTFGFVCPSSYPGSWLPLSGVSTVTLTGVSSLDPSGYVTFTGISTDVPGVASAGGVTVTVPSSGSTSAVQPSGIPAGGISNVVPGGTFGSFVCGTSTGTFGFVC
ncbi:hypothetical protein RNX77_12830, partial [Staphylococcus pseudintermedius]|nr:hypothetical protein [Staphylococcus pseudintermedius]